MLCIHALHNKRSYSMPCLLFAAIFVFDSKWEGITGFIFFPCMQATRVVNGTFQEGPCLPLLKHRFPMNLHTRAIERCRSSAPPTYKHTQAHTRRPLSQWLLNSYGWPLVQSAYGIGLQGAQSAGRTHKKICFGWKSQMVVQRGSYCIFSFQNKLDKMFWHL